VERWNANLLEDATNNDGFTRGGFIFSQRQKKSFKEGSRLEQGLLESHV